MGGLHVHIIAVEASADALGAGLIRALRTHLAADGGSEEALRVSGLGGPLMAGEGVDNPFDITELSIVGLVEGFLAYPRILKRVRETVDHALESKPDTVILIDSWGFTIRVAERLRRAAPDLSLIKYVGPQVWASRPKRAQNLARAVDHVLTLQPFEPPYFEKYGLSATFVGHPVLDDIGQGDGPAFRARHGIAPEQKVVAVLFGSRRAEARRLAGPFAEALTALHDRWGDGLTLIAPLADSIAAEVRALIGSEPGLSRIRAVPSHEKRDAFAAADAALACSGTVVTELSIAQTPTVVAYRLDGLSYAIVSRLMTAPHISLVNMVLGERVLPEFVQDAAAGADLASAVSRFLEDEGLSARVRTRQREAVETMRGGGDASARAARAVLDILAQ